MHKRATPIRDLLRAFFLFWKPFTTSPRQFNVSAAELESIGPGQVQVLTDDSTGEQWAVMHLDDFEHLLGTGNRFRIKKGASRQ